MDTPISASRVHRHFEDELEKLRAYLIRMGSLVDEQVELAAKAVLDADVESARFILKRESRVNEFDVLIDTQCQQILALSQPVAVDLRLLIAAMRINSEFERIGDIAVNLAERAEKLAASSDLLDRMKIEEMLLVSHTMFRDSFDAFINNDAEQARSIFERDDIVDALARDVFDTLIEEMKKNASQIEPCAHIMSLLRHIERLADHATNIAEDVIYIVEAKMMKHQSDDMASM